MASRKNKGKNNRRNTSPSVAPKSSTISEEDAALLEKAKQASKDGEFDLAEYKRLLEEELEREIENKRKEQESKLEESKKHLKESILNR